MMFVMRLEGSRHCEQAALVSKYKYSKCADEVLTRQL